MALGAKQVETRSWKTSFRGLIGIHAAKGYPAYASDFSSAGMGRTLLLRGGYDYNSRPGGQHQDIPEGVLLRPLPFGAILAVGELVDCVPGEIMRDEISDEERHLGDYTYGRWAWIFHNLRALPDPIPARGALQLWQAEPDIAHRLLEFYHKDP